jgi:hypothetical protein
MSKDLIAGQEPTEIKWEDISLELRMNLIDIVQKLGLVKESACTWTQVDEDSELWETECGESFYLESNSPNEGGLKFCCYCGKSLAEEPWTEDKRPPARPFSLIRKVESNTWHCSLFVSPKKFESDIRESFLESKKIRASRVHCDLCGAALVTGFKQIKKEVLIDFAYWHGEERREVDGHY